MSFSFGNFNANQVKPMESRDVLPAGTYTAVITESEMKPTKAAGGERLNLTFQIIEGEHEGRKVWAGLNLKNANPKAEEIAMRELSSICRAVGVITPKQSEDLHDKPLVIKVKVRPADGQYAASNEINGYEPLSGAAPAATTTTTEPAAASKNLPPWKV